MVPKVLPEIKTLKAKLERGLGSDLVARLPLLDPLFRFQVNDTTVLGAGGDYADFQFISDVSPRWE